MGPGADAWGYPTERPLSRGPSERYVALYAAPPTPDERDDDDRHQYFRTTSFFDC